MRYIWQAILHRWYMGYWPVPMNRATLRSQGSIVVWDEYNMSNRQMDEYIDPIIHEEINQLLADILD